MTKKSLSTVLFVTTSIAALLPVAQSIAQAAVLADMAKTVDMLQTREAQDQIQASFQEKIEVLGRDITSFTGEKKIHAQRLKGELEQQLTQIREHFKVSQNGAGHTQQTQQHGREERAGGH